MDALPKSSPRRRLSEEQASKLKQYLAGLETQGARIPGIKTGALAAVNWKMVSEATGVPFDTIMNDIERVHEIFDPYVEKLGVSMSVERSDDDANVLKAVETYLLTLREKKLGVPAKPRGSKTVFDWKKIAEEAGVETASLHRARNRILPLLRSATNELGMRIAEREQSAKVLEPERWLEELRAYISRLEKKRLGVPMRCLQLRPSIDWTTLCLEYDCETLGASKRRREAVVKILMEESERLGVRYNPPGSETLCKAISSLKDRLREATDEELDSLNSKSGRINWPRLEALLEVPPGALEPYHQQIRNYVSLVIESEREQRELADVLKKVNSVLLREFSMGRGGVYLNRRNMTVNLARLAKDTGIPKEVLAKHERAIAAMLSACCESKPD